MLHVGHSNGTTALLFSPQMSRSSVETTSSRAYEKGRKGGYIYRKNSCEGSWVDYLCWGGKRLCPRVCKHRVLISRCLFRFPSDNKSGNSSGDAKRYWWDFAECFWEVDPGIIECFSEHYPFKLSAASRFSMFHAVWSISTSTSIPNVGPSRRFPSMARKFSHQHSASLVLILPHSICIPLTSGRRILRDECLDNVISYLLFAFMGRRPSGQRPHSKLIKSAQLDLLGGCPLCRTRAVDTWRSNIVYYLDFVIAPFTDPEVRCGFGFCHWLLVHVGGMYDESFYFCMLCCRFAFRRLRDSKYGQTWSLNGSSQK
jgi:hypothetical protein